MTKIIPSSGFWIVSLVTLFFLATGISGFGVLAPSEYEKMQSQAPEALEIEVLRVESKPLPEQGVNQVRVTAFIKSVIRSKSGLKSNDVLQIRYEIRMGMEARPGPGEVPLLKEGMVCPAFLAPVENEPVFGPAAGAMSFSQF